MLGEGEGLHIDSAVYEVDGAGLSRDRVPRSEQIHVGVAVDPARGFDVVRPAEDPAVLHGGRSSPPARHHVVDLQPRGRAAHFSIGRLPLALPFIPLHDLPLHLGRHAGLPLRLPLDEQLQRSGEDLLVGRAGTPVGFSSPGLLQQRQELPRHRHVEPARRAGHRLDDRPLDDGPFHPRPRRPKFAWANFWNRLLHLRDRIHRPRRLHTGHHRPRRYQRPRLQLRRQFQGLLLGQAVESRKHRGQVLLRRHRGQHRRGGEAQLPFANRFQHLGESLDEPGASAPVMSRGAGELQPLVEIGEEVRVAEAAEELSPVEFGQGLEEGAQRDELDAEEVDESGMEGAGLEKFGVVRESTVSCDFRPSPSTRECVSQHSRERRSRTSPGAARTGRRGSCAATGAFLA